MAKEKINKKDPARSEENLLAHERTILAQERTLMAWVRTSLSLIGFGFTIFKVFRDLHKDSMLPGRKPGCPKFWCDSGNSWNWFFNCSQRST